MLYKRLPLSVRERIGRGLIAGLHARQRKEARLVEKTITIGGATIPYADSERGTETILLLHGFAGDRTNFYAIAKYLSRSYRVLIPDLPPFGEALPHDSPATVEAQSEIVTQFLDALELQRVHLLGNSMGGHVAAFAAWKLKKDRVASLALLCPSGVDMPQLSRGGKMIEDGKIVFAMRTTEDLARFYTLLFKRVPRGISLVEDAIIAREGPRAALIERWFGDYYAQWNKLEPALASIDVPTFILWGDEDGIIDRSCLPIFQQIPRSRAVVLQGVGHLPMMEAPHETALHYRSFLQDVQRTSLQP